VAERATITINVRAGDAEDDLEELADQLSSAELRAQELDSALDLDSDTVAATASLNQISDAGEEARDEIQRLQRSLNRVGNTDADADVDVDTDRRQGRLPGELDEVGDAVRLFGSLSGQTKALIAATGAAAAALGTAGGLAAIATHLANEFGDLEIQQDLQQTKLQFQEVANTVSDEFEPVLRNELIPAADALARELEGAADSAADFTGETIRFVENAFQQNTGTTGGRIGTGAEVFFNPFQFFGQQLESATGFQPRFPTGRQQPGGQQGIPTPRGAEAVQGGLRQVRVALGKQIRRVQVLKQVSDDQLEVAKARVSALEDARKKALEVAQKFEQGSAESKLIVQFIENLQSRLASARTEAESLKKEQQASADAAERQARAMNGMAVSAKQAALNRQTVQRFQAQGGRSGQLFQQPQFGRTPTIGGTMLRQGQSQGGLMLQAARDAGLVEGFMDFSDVFRGGAGGGRSGQPEGLEAVSMSLQEIQREFGVSEDKARQFKRTANQQLGSVVNAAGQLGQALVRAFSKGEKSAQSIAATLLQGVGGILSVIPGVGQITGPVLSQLGGLLGSAKSGGDFQGPGRIRTHPPEVMIGDGNTQIIGQKETEQILAQASRPQQQTVQVNVTGEIRRLRSRELGLILREDETRRDQFGYSS